MEKTDLKLSELGRIAFRRTMTYYCLSRDTKMDNRQPWWGINRAHLTGSNFLWMNGHVELMIRRPVNYLTDPWSK